MEYLVPDQLAGTFDIPFKVLQEEQFPTLSFGDLLVRCNSIVDVEVMAELAIETLESEPFRLNFHQHDPRRLFWSDDPYLDLPPETLGELERRRACFAHGKIGPTAHGDCDFHPSSEGLVQNIIDPYQHPLATGDTIVQGVDDPAMPEPCWVHKLPAEIEIDADGGSRFTSYMNGLNPRIRPALHWCIERVFDVVLLVLENTMNRSLRWQTLQYYSGMDTLLMDLKTEVTIDARTVEQVNSDWESDLSQQEQAYLKLNYQRMRGVHAPPDDELPIFMGTVPTPAGRILSFPNTLQHKVAGISNPTSGNPTPETPAARNVLAFLLVDPDSPIASTAEVAEQQWGTVGPEVFAVLDAVFRHKGITTGCLIEIFYLIARFAWLDPMPWEQALCIREDLLRMRS
ncbi:hypothetical protein BDK51DRAFT_50828 [Blyttiomyces helicus]|uniref:DUF4246 domain-containing protein n=1 Tax=Blyttiomyces helicus TaxID=388810 RepID=A0A4P9VXX5_9FUNG|nr:hypothetical protein BDK51DRAFT_50828 [Blyttiomyces helicus]|eukprot:RKO84589.1 hypothetical protein BDK51DRAFT_50828 [Blyttiomyces helicus]